MSKLFLAEGPQLGSLLLIRISIELLQFLADLEAQDFIKTLLTLELPEDGVDVADVSFASASTNLLLWLRSLRDTQSSKVLVHLELGVGEAVRIRS